MEQGKSIETIIRQECLPLRDCMLTITDDHGEAAFLYFKEAELIEANYAALWGKEALAQIVTWHLAEHTVAPLPLGIKRSLWDQIEYLLNPAAAPTASGKIPVLPAFNARRSAPASPLDRFRSIAGVIKLLQIEKGREIAVQNLTPEAETENTAWMLEFADRLKSVGDTLGFGTCDKWTIETDKYQVVALRHDESFVVVLRQKDAADDLESTIDAIVEGS